jgi:hypothetical protein
MFCLASVKAKKVRSPIIEDHICDKNSVIQTTTQKTTPKKGSIHLILF